MTFAKLLQLSRPRFWIYAFGPYLVGLAAGATSRNDFLQSPVLVFGLFFLLPANLLIYGVNDIYDYETDKNNAKKIEYETLVAPHERPVLWRAIAVTNIPFLIATVLTLKNRQLALFAALALAAFLFFSLFYSIPPIRAKAKPILDSAFNVLYVCPGIFAYFLIGGHALSPRLVFAAWCWAMAMHAYSAVPDITADRGASLSTVATLLGFRGTLFCCLLLYALSSWLAYSTLGALALALGVIYVTLMILSLLQDTEDKLFRVYRMFPLINALSGAALFFAVLLTRLAVVR